MGLLDYFADVGTLFSTTPYDDVSRDWDFGDELDDDLHYRGDDAQLHADHADAPTQQDESLIDLHDDMFDVFDELGEELFAGGGVTERVAEILIEKREQLEARNAAIRKRLQTAQGVKLLDKITFLLGVMNVAMTGFIAGKYPHYMAYWYSLKFIVLVGARLVVYRQRKWHYFLFDFCYFANVLLMLSIWVFPESLFLFKLTYSFSFGPLAWAVAAWRNSLVFHSVDKVTSVFIHLGPVACVHNLRWWAHSKTTDIGFYRLCANGGCTISFFEATILPLLPYALWQIMYYIKVEWLSPNRNYTTSFRHLVSQNKKGDGLVYKICSKYPEKWRQPVFMVIQLLFTFLTMLPIKLFFDYEVLSTLFYIGIVGVSVWNGGCFYIEVFARKYMSQLPQSRASTPSRRSRSSSRLDPAKLASLIEKSTKKND